MRRISGGEGWINNEGWESKGEREREIERSEVMFFFFFHKDLLWCFLSVVIGLSQNDPCCGTFKCHNRSVIFVFNISGSTYCGAF